MCDEETGWPREGKGIELFNCSKEELERHETPGAIRKLEREQRASIPP